MIATVATGSLGKTIGILKGITGGQGGVADQPHPKEHEVIKMALASYKNIKKLTSTVLGKTGIQFTASATLKQSQTFTGLLGSLFQLGGYAVDILLAPFLPMMVGFLGTISKTVTGLQNFMNDPTGWVKEAWTNFVKDNREEADKDKPDTGGHFGFENIPTHDVTGAVISARTFGDDVMAGEYADRQAHIIATATDLWAQPLIRASEAAAAAAQQATVYSDSSLIAKAAQREAAAQQATVYSDSSLIAKATQRKQREQREHMAGIIGDFSEGDFELQRQYEMGLAMANFIEKRKESNDGQYVLDDMAGFS